MYLDCLLDTERVHLGTIAAKSVESLALFCSLPLLHNFTAKLVLDLCRVFTYLFCIFFVFLYLFLGIPEPFINLLLGKLEFLR